MMHIKIDSLPPISDKWKKKAQDNLIALENEIDNERRNILIDRYKGYWKLFKEELKKVSYNKCWYSETRNPYSHYHIDHFRPKKRALEFDGKPTTGYWWLTFDRKNFRLCGSVGNTKKVDNFAVKYNKVSAPGPIDDEVFYLLDPINQDDVTLLNFDNEGKARPSRPEDLENWNFTRAEYTITKLDLNYPDLVEDRKIKWQLVTILIKKVNEYSITYNNEPTNTNKNKVESEKDKLRQLLKPSEELTSTVKACLRASGQNWAYSLLEEKIEE